MHYIRRMLLLLLALTPLGVCAQTQQSTKTERRSAMTDSVYRLTEVAPQCKLDIHKHFSLRIYPDTLLSDFFFCLRIDFPESNRG